MNKKRSNPFSFFRPASGPAIVLDMLGEKGAADGWVEVLIPKDKRIHRKFLESLHFLVKNHYVGFKDEKNTEITLLPKGKIVYVRTKILRSSLLSEDKACLVVFDIPESKRKLRRFLRIFLNECGFIPIQKSVWISQFDVTKILSEFFAVLDFEEYITVFTILVDKNRVN